MEGTDGLPPEEVIGQMAIGYWISQAICTMAVLGLADHLSTGSRTVDELAGECGAHARSLDRLLRALSALGLCVRDDEGQVRLTQLGELLRSDAPTSMKPNVLIISAPHIQRAWEELPDAVCKMANRPLPASTASVSGTTSPHTRRRARSSTQR